MTLVSSISMTDILQRMEKGGLVIRKRGETDLRTMRVSITQKGREKAEQFLQRELELDDVFFKGFSNEEKDAFLYALARITGNLIDEINSWEEHEVGKDSFPE